MKLLGFLLAAAQAEEDECAPHNGKVSVVELFNRLYHILTRIKVLKNFFEHVEIYHSLKWYVVEGGRLVWPHFHSLD